MNTARNPTKVVSTPATSGRTPVAIMTGMETKPPISPAIAPHPNERRMCRPGTFDFPVERVGLDEQTDPNLVNGGVGNAEDESIQDVSDQRAEDSASLLRRPI